MIALVTILAFLATATASVLPAAPLVAAPLARSSQVIARNYNTLVPAAYAAPAAYVAPAAYATPYAAPAAYAAPVVAPASLAYSSSVVGAPFPYNVPALAAPASPYFFRR